jgi:hypothetical protein
MMRVGEALRGMEVASEPFAPLAYDPNAWSAGKRQALVFWAIYLAGGEPDGEPVTEEQISERLAGLTLEEKTAPPLSALRERFMRREGQDFRMRDGLYRLLPDAEIAVAEHLSKIGNIPDEISAKFRKK